MRINIKKEYNKKVGLLKGCDNKTRSLAKYIMSSKLANLLLEVIIY
jgi:hypothetical protein